MPRKVQMDLASMYSSGALPNGSEVGLWVISGGREFIMPAQGLANGLLPATLGAAHENTKIETLRVLVRITTLMQVV